MKNLVIPTMFSNNTPKNFRISCSNQYKILHDIWSPADWKAFNVYYDVGWRGLPDEQGITWIEIKSKNPILIRELYFSSLEFINNPYDTGFSSVAPSIIKIESDGVEIYFDKIELDKFFSVPQRQCTTYKITFIENKSKSISTDGTYVDLIMAR